MSSPKTIIEGYPIQSIVCSSAQTTVYRAEDPNTGANVAVKVISASANGEDQSLNKCFDRAMRAAQFLRLPAFPGLLNFGFTADNEAFMVMEWVDGLEFAELAGSPPQSIVNVLIQIIDALEALAMTGIYHHNLSPNNLMVDDGGFAKILGFGTAAFVGGTHAASTLSFLPETGRFLAPERLQPPLASTSGTSADVYAIALIAAEALGAEVSELASSEPVVRFPPSVRSGLYGFAQLETAIASALRFDAKTRKGYPVLKNALEQAETLSVPDQPAPRIAPPPPPPPSDPVGKNHEDDADFQTQMTAPLNWQPPAYGDAAPEEPSVAPSPGPQLAATEGAEYSEGLPIASLPVEEQPSAGFDPNHTNPSVEPDSETTPAPPAPPDLPAPPLVIEQVAPTAPKAAGGGMSRGALIAGCVVVGLFLILCLVTVFVWRVRSRPEPLSLPSSVVIRPTPLPQLPVEPDAPTIHPALTLADNLLLDGDMQGARAAIAGLSENEKAAFSEEELEILLGINGALQGSGLEASIADLSGGLEHGSIRMIKRGIAGLERIDESEWEKQENLRSKLEEARNIVRLHSLLWTAKENKDHAKVLEHAIALITALPEYSASHTFRAESAAVLEAEADALAAQTQYSEALARLAPIQKYWRERAGLNARINQIETAKTNLAGQQKIIADALSRGDEGQPEAGLAVLAELSPLPVLRQRFSDARTKLQAQFAELDAQTPEITIVNEGELSFKKKKPVVIIFTISDDYRVSSTSVRIRVGAASNFSEIAMTAGAGKDRFELHISPEVHQNEDFVFYVEATDVSGHTGRLGSPDAPLEVTRKKGLKALFSKN